MAQSNAQRALNVLTVHPVPMGADRLNVPSFLPYAGAAAILAAFLGVGLLGVYRYVDNTGSTAASRRRAIRVRARCRRHVVRTTSRAPRSAAGANRSTSTSRPGTRASGRRYPVLYLLHGEPGRPGAFLETVRMGVVEDELVALHRARPMILVMPFGSTGSFTDKEWANGVRPGEGWETFVARDVVRAIDARYRTIPERRARGIGGLSEGGYGAINIAIHHPGEFAVVESWSGYERPTTSARSSATTGAARGNTPRLIAARARAAAAARAHVLLVLHRQRTTASARRTRRSRASSPVRVRTGSGSYGGHNWALWRGNAADAYLAALAASRIVA